MDSKGNPTTIQEARQLIKDQIRQSGHKVSQYLARDINHAAKAMLARTKASGDFLAETG